ncbi:acetylcholin receptor subunit alpha-like [Arapaima gigas]
MVVWRMQNPGQVSADVGSQRVHVLPHSSNGDFAITWETKVLPEHTGRQPSNLSSFPERGKWVMMGY